MTDFKDPTRLGLWATLALCAYMALKALFTIMMASSSEDVPLVGLLAILYLVALITCYIVVGCWIYRTNANAHLFSSAMSITPGWSIGWFFVPFANLVMPFRGVKETWDESHDFAGRQQDKATPLLGWWWGLWLATNIASNVANLLGRNPSTLQGEAVFNLVSAVLSVGAGVTLIQLIRRLNRAQLIASHGGVFA
jgi:hypothetical protein